MSWDKTQKTALGIASITSFLGPFLISSVNVALPSIEKDLGMNALSLSWIIIAFLLSSAILLLPMGRWADLTGIKKVFRLGIVIFSITTLACGLAPTGNFLIFFRFLQGIGGAMTMTTGPAILVALFPASQRGQVLGIAVASVYMGLAVGPFIGGILTQQLGWRYIFYASSALGLFASAITFIFLGKDQPSDIPKKLNLKGSAIYALALIALVSGSSQIPGLWGWMLLATGFLFIVLFIAYEKRSTYPVLDVSMFSKNRLFAFSNAAALINYSATFAIVFLLSLYLQKVKSLTPQQAGSILLVQPLVMAALSPISGKLSDKLEPRVLASAGMFLCALGLLFFGFMNKETGTTLIIANLVMLGTGFALFSSPNMNTIMSSVPKHQYGAASGISATMRVVGQIVSMTIVTLFLALYVGQNKITMVSDELFLKSMSTAFIAFSIIATVGIGFSYYRGKIVREEE
jgi:EmrB/QacA subfamily drug resistance transporter